MAYHNPIGGTRVGQIVTPPEAVSLRPCKRCGIVAERRATTILCADCKYSMPTAEWPLWGIPMPKPRVRAA